MKILFEKFPVDLIICIIWSFTVLPISLLNLEKTTQIIFSLPFILFIPGYILIFILFPTKKNNKGIGFLERIVLSFSLSVVIFPLIGISIKYTQWGMQTISMLLFLLIFIIIAGIVALYRWFKTPAERRFTIHLNISLPKTKNKLNLFLTITLTVAILISMAILVYIIVTPQTREKFTEFYILGPDNKAVGYPSNLTLDKNSEVTIGLINHEYKTVNYTIEIWLINQTTFFNETSNKNETKYNHMWYIDKLKVKLYHTSINVEESWVSQWEYNYTFKINKSGTFKLTFLLYTDSTEDYIENKDYKDIAEQKINNAYRNLHLWVEIQ